MQPDNYFICIETGKWSKTLVDQGECIVFTVWAGEKLQAIVSG